MKYRSRLLFVVVVYDSQCAMAADVWRVLILCRRRRRSDRWEKRRSFAFVYEE